MSYLANTTRVSSLTIGGTDYTAAFVEFQASDSSAYKNGCIVTTGSLKLGQVPGSYDVSDYDRNDFKRGVPVILDLVEPGGSSYRHPRGYLYVISSAYDVEAEQLEIELGCQLSLAALTDDVSELLPLVPITLDTAQKTFSNISACFASAGQFIYQDNQGALQTGEYFDGDSLSGVAAGQWISVLGVTTLSAQPLTGTGAIPDLIKLSYRVPSDSVAINNKGYVDTVVDISDYFVQYPAIVYTRINTGTGDLSQAFSYTTTRSTSTSTCGNTPPKPSGASDNVTCSEDYEVARTSEHIPARRTRTTVTYYDGPAGQVSRIYEETNGLAIEANAQYYADQYAYCRATYASGCDPNGSCPLYGAKTIPLGYMETVNRYGAANELVETVMDTYVTRLSAANPEDWRSGVVNGVPQDFNATLSETEMYRLSRVITTYFQQENSNTQETVTYQSLSTRGAGYNGSLDALNGIKTTNRRISTTTATLDIAPDRVNTPTTDVTELSSELILSSPGYINPPSASGPYVLEEQIPVPLLFNTQAEIDSTVATYENYIVRFVKGDTYGIQIAESLRSDIVSGWAPNMPFRYYDAANNRLIALRMDATTWGVSREESSLVTNGMWIGYSNGTVTIPENLVGNSQPDMTIPPGQGGTPTSPTAVVPPSVDNETAVDSGNLAWIVNVEINLSTQMVAFGNDGVVPILPSDLNVSTSFSFACYVDGIIVAPGDLLATESNGSIPLNAGGQLVVVGATIIDANLFS